MASTHSARRPSDRVLIMRALTPALRRLSIALVLAVAAMALFVYVAHKMLEGRTVAVDRLILAYFGRIHSPLFHSAMLFISILAGPIFQTLFCLFTIGWFTWKKRFWPDGLTMVVAGVGGLVLVVGLKYLFHRPRPQVIYDHLGYSFPSGHSFFALVIYGMTAYWLTRDLHEPHQRLIWTLASVLIFLVGFSRVALGEHFPSDVLAGFAIALPWLWACLAIPKTFHRHGRDITSSEASEQPLSIL